MKQTLLAVAILLIALAGCHRNTPPEVTAGLTKCATDGVQIDDLTTAAVARSKDGTEKAFDRAKCLMKTIPEGDEWQVWFHDTDTPQWIEASKAVFVIHRDSMVGGIQSVHAFPDRKLANAFYERTPGRNEIAPDYATLRGVSRLYP